jgi:hypothetical protein
MSQRMKTSLRTSFVPIWAIALAAVLTEIAQVTLRPIISAYVAPPVVGILVLFLVFCLVLAVRYRRALTGLLTKKRQDTAAKDENLSARRI